MSDENKPVESKEEVAPPESTGEAPKLEVPTTGVASENSGVSETTIGEARELSFGEKAVGLTFNPSNDPHVQRVKELFAEIINLYNIERGLAGPGEKARLFSVAITEAQGAQMWGVKAITWK